MEPITEDRFTRGLIAGVFAGIVVTGWNLFSYYVLHFTTLLWEDFSAAIIFRRKAANSWEFFFAMLIAILFSSILGILFSLLIPTIKSRFLWLKGLTYGVVIWFSIWAVTIMHKVPTLTKVPSKTSAATFISAIIWGILLAVFLSVMKNRLKNRL